jgi:dolichol-phosphate mannosyltransferase
LVPLTVFAVFSLFQEVKLNWTGPLWLAVLPGVAQNLAAEGDAELWMGMRPRRVWLATFALMLFTYGAALHFMVFGLPGVDLNTSSLSALPIGWKEFGTEVEKVEGDFEHTTGKKPLLVGMDRYFQSSQIAFYDPDGDGVGNTAGRSLFGLDSLMYGRWFTPAAARGHDILLFGWRPNIISGDALSSHFEKMGPIQERWVDKGGMRLARFYYRVGHSYHAN